MVANGFYCTYTISEINEAIINLDLNAKERKIKTVRNLTFGSFGIRRQTRQRSDQAIRQKILITQELTFRITIFTKYIRLQCKRSLKTIADYVITEQKSFEMK